MTKAIAHQKLCATHKLTITNDRNVIRDFRIEIMSNESGGYTADVYVRIRDRAPQVNEAINDLWVQDPYFAQPAKDEGEALHEAEERCKSMADAR